MFSELRELGEVGVYEGVAVVALVGQRAMGAVLYACVGVGEPASATGPERIERAEAEQAVEQVGVNAFMAGEVGAAAVGEEGKCRVDRAGTPAFALVGALRGWANRASFAALVLAVVLYC